MAGAMTGGLLTACEYTYDDGGWRPAAPEESSAATEDRARRSPRLPAVGPDDLASWAATAISGAPGEVLKTSTGMLGQDDVSFETAGPVPAGKYTVSLACQSVGRVGFTIRDDNVARVDLILRCGKAQVHELTVGETSFISVRITSQERANFVFSITRR